MEQTNRSENKIWDIIVVGGGAAGLMAAIQAARAGASVLILEHMEQPGKKILMTGNGKCNFSNQMLQEINDWQDEQTCEEYYHGARPAFVMSALKKFNVQATLDFFGDLGIVPVLRKGGYYPSCGQASAVLSVMLMECERLNICIQCNIGIRSIEQSKKAGKNSSKKEQVFIFNTKSGSFFSRKCILATGGRSYKKTGSDGSGFLYVERLGHHLKDLVPALVPLQSDLPFFKKTAGIRTDITAKIYVNGKMKDEQSGELQLTDYGISGICIFQLSHLASRAFLQETKDHAADVAVELDFVPWMSDAEVLDFLMNRFHHPNAKNKTAAKCLIGWLADRLGEALLEEAGIEPTQLSMTLTQQQCMAFAKTCKHFFVPIHATRSFEQAQVSAGGIDTSEVFVDSMESRLVPGLYFAGEMLDVDGICGGFNLQWAWSSGAIAGSHAAAAVKGSATL